MSNYPSGYREPPTEEDYYQTAIDKLETENAALIAERDSLVELLALVNEEALKVEKERDNLKATLAAKDAYTTRLVDERNALRAQISLANNKWVPQSTDRWGL